MSFITGNIMEHQDQQRDRDLYSNNTDNAVFDIGEILSQVIPDDDQVFTEMDPVEQDKLKTLMGVIMNTASTVPQMSWTTKHPENWSNSEILDWLHSLTDLRPDLKIDSRQLRVEVSCITRTLLPR